MRLSNHVMHSNSFWSHLIRSDRSWSQTIDPDRSRDISNLIKNIFNQSKSFLLSLQRNTHHQPHYPYYYPILISHREIIPSRTNHWYPGGNIFSPFLWFFEIFVVFSRIFNRLRCYWEYVRLWEIEKNYEIETW